MDQHANAFAETLSQSVQKDIAPGIRPGIVPESSKGQETWTVIGTKTGTKTANTRDHAGRIVPNVKIKIAPKSAPIAVIGGQALQDWIRAKGFNGETTSSQRASIERVKESPKRDNKTVKGHL
jgi:hypothetical protein